MAKNNNTISLSGQNITLRAPEPDDIDTLYLWENDPSLWPYGSSRAPMSRHQLWQYVENYDGDIFTSRQLRLMIVENKTGDTVGTIDLYDFNPRDSHAMVGIFIDNDHRRKGYAKEALVTMIDFAIRTICLHQIAVEIVADNTASVKLFKSCGFKSVGRLRSWVRIGRHYNDVLLFQRLTALPLSH